MDEAGSEDDQADRKPAAHENFNETADDTVNARVDEDEGSKASSHEEDLAPEKSSGLSMQTLAAGVASEVSGFASGLASAVGKRGQTIVLSSEERSSNDILCGRGIPFQKYPGNQRMRRIVHQHRLAYSCSKRHEKGNIVQTVIRKIKENGARFLHPLDEAGEKWVEAEQDYIYEKISHAMRQRPKNAAAKAARRENESKSDSGEPVAPSKKAGRAASSTASATIAVARPDDRHPQGDGLTAAFPNTFAGMGLFPPVLQHPTTAALAASSSSQTNDNALFNLMSSSAQEAAPPPDASGGSLNPNVSAQLQRLLQAEHLNRLLAHQQLAAPNIHPRVLRPDELLLQLQLQNQQRIEAEREAARLRTLLELRLRTATAGGQQSLYSSNLQNAATTTVAATASQAQAPTGTTASVSPAEWFAAVEQEVQRRTLLGLPSLPTAPTGLTANQLRSLALMGTAGLAAPVAMVTAQAVADREAQMRALNLRSLVELVSAQQQQASSSTLSNVSTEATAAPGLAAPSPPSSAGTTESPPTGTTASEEELQLLRQLELARTRDASRL